jgi:PIN domain nuclease of toxin-antitoxin system
MDYLADTVTVIRHFSKTGKIGKQAREILEKAEQGGHHLYISIISLVEIMYLSQKQRIDINLSETLDTINKSVNYSVVDLTPHIVRIAEQIDYPELMDRLIIATAHFLNLAIITSDKDIRNSKIIKTLWS